MATVAVSIWRILYPPHIVGAIVKPCNFATMSEMPWRAMRGLLLTKFDTNRLKIFELITCKEICVVDAK